MNKVYQFTYTISPIHGSESKQGWSIFNYSPCRTICFTPKSSFENFNLPTRNIYNIRFKKINNSKIIICLGNFKQANSGFTWRLYFFLWVIKAQFFSLRLKNYQRIHYVNASQIFAPFFLHLLKERVIYGPLGGQCIPWTSLLPFKINLKYFLLKITLGKLIKLVSYFRYPTYIVINQSLRGMLSKAAKAYIFTNTFQTPRKESVNYPKRSLVTFFGNRIPIKQPQLTKNLFKSLSKVYPQYQFVIAGNNWEDYKSNNLRIFSELPQELVFKYLKETRLNIFLSLEMGGNICLESCRFGAPSFCLEGFGADIMLSPSKEFITSIEEIESHGVEGLLRSIGNIIDNSESLSKECESQYNNSLKNNEERIEQFLDQIYCD